MRKRVSMHFAVRHFAQMRKGLRVPINFGGEVTFIPKKSVQPALCHVRRFEEEQEEREERFLALGKA